MGYSFDNGVFKNMRKGPWPMSCRRMVRLYGFGFTVEYEVPFGGQLRDSFAHQVESSQRVLEPGVLCTGIDYG